MAKKTKRSRKFEKKGGVQGHLRKGTITNKGKLKRASRSSKGNNTAAEQKSIVEPEDRHVNDFIDTNVGDLDMDAFFKTFEDESSDQEESSNDEEEEEEDEQDEVKKKETEDCPKDIKDSESSSSSSSSSSSDDSESSDDDDDDDVEEEKDESKEKRETVGKQKKADKDNEESDSSSSVEEASKQMKEKMANLAKTDPDFYQFLKESGDTSVLEYGEQDEKNENEEDEEHEAPTPSHSNVITVTHTLLQTYKEQAFESHNIKSLKRIVAVYKTACHIADVQDNDDLQQQKRLYVMENSQVYDDLMVSCLENCHKEFEHHLLKDEKKEEGKEEDESASDKYNKPIQPKRLKRSPKWNNMKPIMVSFFKATNHLLNQAKEPQLLAYVLKALEPYLPYMSPHEKLPNPLLATLIALWSSSTNSSVKLQAFVRIRQMALVLPFPFIETCLKKTYLALAKRAKFVSNDQNMASLLFLGNGIVELYGLDPHKSYQHAFVYIRQLALLLRTAMQKRTPESLQAVYCWQYMHCLKLWTAVLVSSSSLESGSMLQSLVYPLVEVILGVTRLLPASRFVPLRLHCVQMLQQLAAAFRMYIPTTSLLLDVLDLKEVHQKPKRISNKSTTRGGIDLNMMIKLPQDAPLRTTEQLNAVVSRIFVLLNREIDLYRYSAGFAEFSIGIIQRLRKFCKETRNSSWRASARACIETSQGHAKSCIQQRAKLEEAPIDVKILEVLKPTDAPNMWERHEASIDKEKKLQQQQMFVETKVEAPKSTEAKKRKADNKEPETKRKKKKAPIVNKADLENTAALNEEDQVEEGIDWSDSEEDESD